MYVETYMSKHVISISKNTKILEALDIMKEHDIHRLPVIEEGKLIGLITEGVIQGSTPSKATSLSIHELNYLLTKTTVEDIMLTKVITISPTDLLEEAAQQMYENQVGVLPVVENNKVIGIITHNDIFAAFIDLMGYYQEGCRVAIHIEDDHKGILAEITKLFADYEISINQIAVYRKSGTPEIVMQVAHPDCTFIEAILTEKGYVVTSCVVKNKESAE